MSDLAVVVVTYNSADWIGRFLDTLPTALGDRTAEVVVVDNASADDSAGVVAQHPAETTLLRNDVNVGFAAAVNQGVAASTAHWVLLLNPDMEIRPGAIAALVAFAERHPEHRLYGGRTLKVDGSVEPSSCWDLPTLWSTFCFSSGLSTAFRRSKLFDPEAIGGWDRDSVREVGMITGCMLLTDRRTWEQLGGLDERYFVYGEDADFSARARALGARPVITPDAQAMHVIGVSSPSDGRKTLLLLAGKVTYARTHFAPRRREAAVALLRTGVALRAVGSRLTGRGKKWAFAWANRDQWENGFPARSY